MYSDEPERDERLIVHAERPFNAEPNPAELIESFLTPAELFYVRNHLPVPRIAPEEYRLRVSVEGKEQELTLTLDDLKQKFDKHSVVSVIQCGGNRRQGMADYKSVKGGKWLQCAIANAAVSYTHLTLPTTPYV